MQEMAILINKCHKSNKWPKAIYPRFNLDVSRISRSSPVSGYPCVTCTASPCRYRQASGMLAWRYPGRIGSQTRAFPGMHHMGISGGTIPPHHPPGCDYHHPGGCICTSSGVVAGRRSSFRCTGPLGSAGSGVRAGPAPTPRRISKDPVHLHSCAPVFGILGN